MNAPCHLEMPGTVESCAVFASPHSARVYPPDLLTRSVLDQRALRSSEDAYVDLLVQSAPALGAPLLLGGVPRAYVDVNRAAGELDPALIDGVPRGVLNPRVASGLGVIPRVVAGGRAIYRGKLTRAEAERRIAAFWVPYHDTLSELLAAQRARFGMAILFDMHSMPHEAIAGHARRGQPAPQVVIGDRFGASAAPGLVEAVEGIFAATGLRVARNTPFAGAYVAQTYGQPSQGQHVIQIEIDRALYLDEHRVEPHVGFAGFRALMDDVVAALAALGREGRTAQPLAAE